MNNELTKFYLSQSSVQVNPMPETAYFDIIKALDKHFNKCWAWTLESETFAMNDTRVSATVHLYVPGHVYTGRATCEVKDFATVHLFALTDACQTFMEKENANPIQQPSPQTNNMTSEQIMNAINGNNQMNNAAQVYNHKDSNGVQSDTVPYDGVTDQAHKELENEINGAMNQPTQPNPSQNNAQQNSDYERPKPELNGYSQRQIDDIEKFKQKWDIVNNQMFNNYIQMWNKNFTKANLNPQNIDDFLKFTEKLGK